MLSKKYLIQDTIKKENKMTGLILKTCRGDGKSSRGDRLERCGENKPDDSGRGVGRQRLYFRETVHSAVNL